MNNQQRLAMKQWLQDYLFKISQELDKVMDFWFRNSHDTEYGGFFNCLGADGKRYDDNKYGWLQGRQVWMYSRLYNEVPRFRKPEILEAAVAGAEFIMKHIKDKKTGRCYFQVTRDGKPIKLQRTIFTECFYTLGLLEVYRATSDLRYKLEGLSTLDRIVYWVQEDDTKLGKPRLSGAPACNVLSVPMMLLCLVDEIEVVDSETAMNYEKLKEWSISQILQHIQRSGSIILEKVSLEGRELPGSEGRLINPGHAIEAGWFLLKEAMKDNDSALVKIATETFIRTSYNRGWDGHRGGLFYYLDADGLSPVQLEWGMKLWWPHTELMIASLMSYQVTGRKEWADMFESVTKYALIQFSDSTYGEWYGYLDRENRLNQNFKGGPFKGCFHVPRALMICESILRKILNDNSS